MSSAAHVIEGRSPGRRRSLSLAETGVETVMVKAKRAALSLWMLLHAQDCSLGQKCPYAGCQEAKLLHLHLKTCRTGCNYHGCEQSRKLLAHYRKCRAVRLAKHAKATQRNESTNHYCLVCSLVARQARTLLLKNNRSLMPPPPPRTSEDSLRRLYETAKHLDGKKARTRSVSEEDTKTTTRLRSDSMGSLSLLSVASSRCLPIESIVEEDEICEEKKQEQLAE